MNLGQPDRDMLITLNTKVDRLTEDVKDIKDSTLVRIVRLESWKDSVDIYHARINLDRFEELANWVTKVRDNYRLAAALLVVFGGLIGGLVDHILQTMFPILK